MHVRRAAFPKTGSFKSTRHLEQLSAFVSSPVFLNDNSTCSFPQEFSPIDSVKMKILKVALIN